jgi:hypothetical protein
MLDRIQEIREAARNGQHLSIEDIYLLEQTLTHKENTIQELVDCIHMLVKTMSEPYEMT